MVDRWYSKKAYQQLKYFDTLDSRSAELLEHQQRALEALIQHTTATTDYYKKVSGRTLEDFPIINKEIIRQHQDEFLSNTFDKSKLIRMSTSGSTGTPFVCFQDAAKKKRVNAEVIYYSEKAGYVLGHPLIFLRAVTEETQKSKLRQFAQNQILIDISGLDDERIAELLNDVERISSRSGAMILGYASTFDALRDYFKGNGLMADMIRVHGVVSSSEMLYDTTRNAMRDFFECECYSRYSNQENGIIGQDDIENNTFILNETNYIVEIFDFDTDVPVPEGKVGRIVITDLFNKAMPMIRYDTGDIGSISYVKRNGVTKRAITNFGGRRVDVVFDCNGKRLSPHSISNHLWAFPEIVQYQFIQEDDGVYTVRLNTNSGFHRENELKGLLLKLLGDGAKIRIEEVDEIPVLASGKRQYIVNRMAKSS